MATFTIYLLRESVATAEDAVVTGGRSVNFDQR
jgi:hypothetical protein